MNTFAKHMIRLALSAIVIGILLIIISFHEYNPFDDIRNNVRDNVNVNVNSNAVDPDINIDLGDIKVNTDMDSDGEYDNQDSYTSEKHSDIKSLGLAISVGTVTIEEGEYFQVEATNIEEEDFSETINNGEWRIEYKPNISSVNNVIDVMGMEISLGPIHIGDSQKPSFKITVPKDFYAKNMVIDLNTATLKADSLDADNLDINLNTGEMNLENIVAQKADIYVNTGHATVDKMQVAQKTYLEVNTGDFIIDDINAKDIKAKCGVGKLDFTGVITGDNYIDNNVGDVEINVEGNKNDYNYDVNCGYGSVIINDEKYSDVKTQVESNMNAKNNFTIGCGVGKVKLNIN